MKWEFEFGSTFIFLWHLKEMEHKSCGISFLPYVKRILLFFITVKNDMFGLDIYHLILLSWGISIFNNVKFNSKIKEVSGRQNSYFFYS